MESPPVHASNKRFGFLKEDIVGVQGRGDVAQAGIKHTAIRQNTRCQRVDHGEFDPGVGKAQEAAVGADSIKGLTSLSEAVP